MLQRLRDRHQQQSSRDPKERKDGATATKTLKCCKLHVDTDKLRKEGGVFKLYDEPESPGACLSASYYLLFKI